MIKITSTPKGTSAARLRVEGRIVGTAIDEVEAAVAEFAADASPILDLAGVTFVDHDAARAIGAMIRGGVAVVGRRHSSKRCCARRRRLRGRRRAAPRRGVAARRPGGVRGVVRRYGGRMLAVARRMLRVEEDARDAVQEAFVSAFKARDGFAGNARLSTWLHRIVVNAALMRLRRQRRKPEESIDELLPRFDESGEWCDDETRATTRPISSSAPRPASSSASASIACRRRTGRSSCCATSRSSTRTRRGQARHERHRREDASHRARQALRTLLVQRLAVTESTLHGVDDRAPLCVAPSRDRAQRSWTGA